MRYLVVGDTASNAPLEANETTTALIIHNAADSTVSPAVNAVVVSLAANGAFDAVTAKHTNN